MPKPYSTHGVMAIIVAKVTRQLADEERLRMQRNADRSPDVRGRR
jgi:hypothetical protein